MGIYKAQDRHDKAVVRWVVSRYWPQREGRFRKVMANAAQAKVLDQRITAAIVDGTWRELKRELEGEQPPQLLTVRQLANRFIEARQRRKMATWKNYSRALDSLCDMRSSGGGTFGDMPVAEFRRRHAREFEEERLKELSAASVNRDIAAISSMFSYAVELELVDMHPLVKFSRNKEQEHRFIPLTPEEVERLIEAQQTVVMTAYVLILSETGLRKSEGLTLKWQQIDFDHKVLTTDQTKNHRSRDIPLSDRALDCLRGLVRHIRHQEVFIRHTGRPLKSPDDPFAKAVAKAGLPSDTGFHDLRRYRASEWHYRQGHSVREVQYLLGHSDIAVTERYLGIDRGLADRVRRAQNLQVDSRAGGKQAADEASA